MKEQFSFISLKTFHVQVISFLIGKFFTYEFLLVSFSYSLKIQFTNFFLEVEKTILSDFKS